MNSVDTQRLYNCSALVLRQDISVVRDLNRSELLNALEEALSDSMQRDIVRDTLAICLFPGQQKPFDLPWWQKLSWGLIFAAMLLVAIGGNTIVMWIVLGNENKTTNEAGMNSVRPKRIVSVLRQQQPAIVYVTV